MDLVLMFRSSIDGFDPSEFNIFINNLFKQFDQRTLITKALFSLLLNQIKKNETNQTKQINKIITNIIVLRKNQKKKKKLISNINKTNKVSFNNLASEVISEIGSYLELKSLSSFIRCNRYIAISSHRISSTFYSLMQGKWYNRYIGNYGYRFILHQKEKIVNFRNVKQLSLTANVLRSNFNDGNLWKFNDMNLLEIKGLCPSRCFSLYDNNLHSDSLLIPKWFMNKLQKMRIKALKIDDISIKTENQHNEFINLISCNKGIQCLSLGFNENQFIWKTDFSILNRLRHLNCLILDGGNFNKLMIETFRNQLQSLHICGRNLPSINNKIGYPKLIELKASQIDRDEINGFIQNAPHLKRFQWMMTPYISTDDMKYVYNKLLNQCKSLEYLCIVSGYGHSISNLLNPLLNVLQNTKIQRKNFRLEVKHSNRIGIHLDGVNYIQNRILNMIDALNNITLKDFIFILEFGILEAIHSGFKNKEIALSTIKSKFVVHYNKTKEPFRADTKHQVIVLNKGNMMNGYNEKWMFPY